MAVLGMRGTGSWTTPDERPKNYREAILWLYPHDKAPLMAMLGKLQEEGCDDPEFKVFIKGLPAQRALVTAAGYDNSSNPVDINFKTAGDYKMYKAGHVVINERTLEVMWVTAAASNKITVAREIGSQAMVAGLEDDGILVCGSRHPEGSDVPTAIMYDPTVISNYLQIFRNSLDQTNTARATRLRTGDQVKQAQKECLLLHNIEMERAFLFGVAHEATGANGQPERGTQGMLFHISTNVKDYSAGLNIDTFENDLEDLFRYGSGQKLWLGGARTINCLNKLARINGYMMMDVPSQEAYGLAIQRWRTPFGELLLKIHPLMSENPTFNKWAFIFDTGQLRYRYLKTRDTKYLRNRQSPGLDAQKDEYLTEAGLEGRHENTHALIKNLSVVLAE